MSAFRHQSRDLDAVSLRGECCASADRPASIAPGWPIGDAIQEAAARAGLPADIVMELAGELRPVSG